MTITSLCDGSLTLLRWCLCARARARAWERERESVIDSLPQQLLHSSTLSAAERHGAFCLFYFPPLYACQPRALRLLFRLYLYLYFNFWLCCWPAWTLPAPVMTKTEGATGKSWTTRAAFFQEQVWQWEQLRPLQHGSAVGQRHWAAAGVSRLSAAGEPHPDRQRQLQQRQLHSQPETSNQSQRWAAPHCSSLHCSFRLHLRFFSSFHIFSHFIS